ncbi:hypothetical protein DQ04_02891040 [Trypanosoma grayi]|uniref:hypothetical protein n=1 Tax=Trypanosoma grayi TaxID=71804 RepID=UPI0004F4217F|nr:hypothetical protein DQ04_02891040 [Trypanosoma grayi]KEG11179.1 hypothetical protein DQ04_02891040 [Trypanosoma grayi]
MQPSVTHQFKMSWCWPEAPLNPTDVVPNGARRVIGSTSIIELRGDPHLEGGSRRVALVMSCGCRFLLPLLPETRESAVVRESGIFWRVPSRPYQKPAPPPFAELLVGPLQQVEKAAKLVEKAFSSPNAQSDENTESEEGSVKKSSGTSLQGLGSFFFQTLPYRTLWLYQFCECLLVSLPCEERLLTLGLQHGERSTRITSQLSTTTIECIGSFRLPPCVVPLDVSEVYERPFVAVGTVCHGILVLLLREDGVCVSIAHRLPLTSIATSMFPVTRICTVFPPLTHNDDKSGILGVWGSKSARVSQCLDGAILCASPYENRTVALKCASAGGDCCGAEMPPPTRTLAGFLCSTPYSSPSFGPLIATLEGKLMQVVTDDALRLEAREKTNKTSQSDEGRQHYGAFDAVCPEVAYDNTTRPLLGATPNHFCEGGAVRQKVSHSKYQPRFIRHWLCMSTLNQELVLLDRKLTNYTKHSTITLSIPSPGSEGATSAVNTMKSSQSKEILKEKDSDKEDDTPRVTVEPNTYPAALEDGIAGLSWLVVNDGVLQAVAAHHQSWLTVVTWRTWKPVCSLCKK